MNILSQISKSNEAKTQILQYCFVDFNIDFDFYADDTQLYLSCDSHQTLTVSQFSLQLNVDKILTKIYVLGQFFFLNNYISNRLSLSVPLNNSTETETLI